MSKSLVFLGTNFYSIKQTCTCPLPRNKLRHNKRETSSQIGTDNPIRHAIMLKPSKHGQLQSILLDAD